MNRINFQRTVWFVVSLIVAVDDDMVLLKIVIVDNVGTGDEVKNARVDDDDEIVGAIDVDDEGRVDDLLAVVVGSGELDDCLEVVDVDADRIFINKGE